MVVSALVVSVLSSVVLANFIVVIAAVVVVIAVMDYRMTLTNFFQIVSDEGRRRRKNI
jgi:uncharacterized membrane protein YdfJ with MMPL/SSD domain